MHEESIVHRALALGAIAFAFLIGATIPQYEPPAQGPVPALIITDDERSQQAAQPEPTYAVNEPIAGSAPGQNYRVMFTGPSFSKTVDLSIPNPLVGSIYMGDTRLDSMDYDLQALEISFQPEAEAPHFVVNADAELFKSRAFSWFPQSLDLGAMKVDRIEITPAPVPTLAPAPEAPISFHTVLEDISACLTVAAAAAELIGKSRKSETRVKPVALDDDAVLVTTVDGGEHTVITKADLENSDDSDRRLILTLSASIRKHFDLWAAVYPDRDSSADAAAKSGELQRSLCADLSRLKGYIEKTGRQLSGFEAIEVVCQG